MNGRRPTGYTSAEFQRVRKALLECAPGDRAFFRCCALMWLDEQGRVWPGAEELPNKGRQKLAATSSLPRTLEFHYGM